MMIALLPFMSRAQDTVSVSFGNGITEERYLPFNTCYKYSYSQSIYPADSLVAGYIHSISWNCVSPASSTMNILKIYMGTTEDFDNQQNGFLPNNELSLVYEGSNVLIGAASGWQTIDLTTPFLYDGLENLVIVVAKYTSSMNCNTEYYVTEQTSQYASIINYGDQNSTYMENPGAHNYLNHLNSVPNIQLEVLPVVTTCPYPTQLAISDVTESSAELSWTPGAYETSWDIYVTTQPELIPNSSTPPSYTTIVPQLSFSNLAPTTTYYVFVRANCGDGDYSVWRSINFATVQMMAMVPYIYDFEDETENSFWEFVGTDANQWFIGTAVNATPEGAKSLYVSSDNGVSNNYNPSASSVAWAYRDIYFDESYAEFNISFKFKGIGEPDFHSDELWLYLGEPAEISANGVAPQGATLLGVYSQTPNWTEVSEVVDASFGGIQRIYFLWKNNQFTGYQPAAAVDDISITGTTCGKPQNLRVTDNGLTSSSIEFEFTPAHVNDNLWEVVIVELGDTIDESQVIMISDTTYLFDGLTQNRTYRIYARTQCDMFSSFWSEMLEVHVPCNPFMELPLTESFDIYTEEFPPCWNRNYNCAEAFRPVIVTDQSSSAPSSLRLYSYSNPSFPTISKYSCVVVPAVDTSVTAMSQMTVNFKILKNSTNAGAGALQVGVMSNPEDISTFVPVHSYNGYEWSATNTWYNEEVQLTNYSGNGVYIAFLKPSTTSEYTFIDDINIFATSNCLSPTDIVVSEVTDNTLTVGWTARNEEDAWQVAVVPAGDNVNSVGFETVYTNPCTIAGLNENTTYDVYVKALCSNSEESAWTYPITSTTNCSPIGEIPYNQSFDSYSNQNIQIPSCWTILTNNLAQQAVFMTTDQASSGTTALRLNSSSEYYACAILPEFTSSYAINTLQVSFKALKTSISDGLIEVGVITNASDISTFVPIRTIDATMYEAPSLWQDFVVALNGYTGGHGRIAFRSPSIFNSSVFIDDVQVSIFSGCVTPSNFNVQAISGSSAYLTWTDDYSAESSQVYFVEYSEPGSNIWHGGTPDGTNCLLTGLTPNTSYDVILYASCGSSYSDTVALSFSTVCFAGGEVAIGNGTTTTSFLPARGNYKFSLTQQLFTAEEMGGSNTLRGVKFYIENSSNQTRNWTIYLGTTTQSALIPASYVSTIGHTQVFSGAVPVSETGWLEISFDTPFIYSGNNLVLTVDDNTGSYFGAPTFRQHAGSSLTFYDDNLNPNPANHTSFNQRQERNDVIFVGDCDSTVTCVPPVMIARNITSNNVDLFWAPALSESAWELEYKQENDSVWILEGVVYQPEHVISNLTPNTTYQLRLRSVCSTTEFSEYSLLSFTTPCAAIDLPFMDNFDSYAANTFPECWFGETSYYAGNYPYISSAKSFIPGGNSLYMINSTPDSYTFAATPRFADGVQMDSLLISFKTYTNYSSDYIEVGIVSNPDDLSTFVPITNITINQADVWENQAVYTRGYSGNGRYVAFRVPMGLAHSIYIDELSILTIPACEGVDNLVATVDTTSVTITWVPGDQETEWDVVILPAGPVDLDTIYNYSTVNTTTYSLGGLFPSTTYSAYVRPRCSNNEGGAWERVDFATTQIPGQLPFYCDFENNIPSWGFFNGNYTNRWYIGNGTSSTGSNALYISSDNGVSNQYNQLATSFTWAYRDIYFPANENGYVISFDWRNSGENGFDVLNVFIGEPMEIVNPNSHQTIYGYDGMQKLNDLALHSYSVFTSLTAHIDGFATAGVRRIYFSWHNDHMEGNNPPAAIDNVSIFELTCTVPTNLTASASTTTSMDLIWTPSGNENNWQVAYKEEDDNWNNALTMNVSTPYCTLSGLTPAMGYDIRVKAICGPADESVWSSVLSVIPGEYLLPYSGGDTITTCETVIYDNGGADDTYDANTDAVLVINPGTPGAYVAINGNIDIEENYDYLYIYDGVGLNGIPMKVYSGDIIVSDTSLTGSLTLHFITDNMYDYDGLALVVTCSSTPAGGSNVDPCDVPTNVQVTPAETSAVVTWNSPETNWIVEYKAATANSWTASAALNVPTYSISGLTPSTDYMVRVKSVCGNGNESNWSAEVPFTTMAAQVNTYTITATATGPGTITPTGAITVNEGDNATFTFTADAGAVIDQLLVDDVETAIPADNSYTFSNIVANHTIAVEFVEETGISENDLSAAVVLYPNPATSQVQIRVADSRLVGAEMQLFDAYGKIVATSVLESNMAQVDVSHLANGIYLVRINAAEGVVTKRFVKR